MPNTEKPQTQPKGKAKINKKISHKKEEIKTFLNKVYLGEDTYNKVTKKIVNFVRVLIVATKKFITDDCFTKASSIAYTVIVSLIPTLTVMLTVYSGMQGIRNNKSKFFSDISTFIQEHNIDIDTTIIFNALSLLIDNATRIGIIGGVVVVFSATAMLRSLEKSLNHIWKVKKQRPLFLKIVYYWTALSLGPLLIGAGTTAANRIFEIFSSPNINSIYITHGNNVIAVGDKGTLYSGTDKLQQELEALPVEQIDFEDQKFFKYNQSSKTFTIENKTIDKIAFRKYNLTGLVFNKNRGWAVGSEGLLLETSDYGKNWKIKRIDKFNLSAVTIVNNETIFITGEGGLLLRSDLSANNWERVPFKNLPVNLKSISFNKNRGIICGNSGYLLNTDDFGTTWNVQRINDAEYKGRHLHLNNSFFINKDRIVVIGDHGLILHSTDGGKNWKKQSYSNYNYQTAFFYNNNEGLIGGSRGTLLRTDDAGKNWSRTTLPTYEINKIIISNNTLIAIGSAGMFMKSTDRGRTWTGIEGKGILVNTLNFIAPFIFIWLFFLICYKTLPNMKIPFKHAAIGSAFTAAIWVIFILVFIIYVNAFARITFAIYNTLAAVPLFLLMVYASSVIILFGAEVAYTLMHPDSYKNLHRTFKDRNDIVSYYGISLLYNIYKKFESGKGETYFSEMLVITSQRAEQVDFFLELFQRKGYILQQTDNGYIPANASKNIKLTDIIGTIHDINLNIPTTAIGAGLKKYIRELFGEITIARDKILSNLTLKDIIDNA